MMSEIRDFQLPLFGGIDTNQIINVASVPLRSPFRYPGGKTWLVPFIRQWLISCPTRPAEFVEPFAGGAIIGLTVAFEKLADHVTLVELDGQVGAVWKTIINGDYEWLANKIIEFNMTTENVDEELSKVVFSENEIAFQTILRNRINRGGILAPGAGKIKNGENGKGLKSRWYPDTLRKRILDIGKIRDRISFIEGDGIHFMQENALRPDSVFFIDPPYTAGGKKAGTRLYTYYEIDHQMVFSVAASLKGDFLMTYDNAVDVKSLAEEHGFSTELIAMKNTHHAQMTELLISSNLKWLKG